MSDPTFCACYDAEKQECAREEIGRDCWCHPYPAPIRNVIKLSDRERDRVLDALENPPAPNEALRKAALVVDLERRVAAMLTAALEDIVSYTCPVCGDSYDRKDNVVEPCKGCGCPGAS
jgi:rubrerythrin